MDETRTTQTTASDDEYEAFLLDRIQEIQRRAQAEAQPYVDRLVQIKALRAPSWTISRAQAEALQIDWSRIERKMK